MPNSIDTSEDPFTRALAPPSDESPEQAEARTCAERLAAKVSEEIDKELRLEGLANKRKRCVKILLLGQSESGKSTVLKNFQRKYDPSAFDRERAVWRAVCQLNVVRSFGIILDALHTALAAQNPDDPGPLTPSHRRLAMRLAPLRQIEHALTRRFRPGAPPRSQELYVNGWAWQRAREGDADALGPVNGDDDLARVLAACREDMEELWADPVVRDLLRERRIGVEELSGFFLDDLSRIAVPHYAPTDDDVLRARLKTIGVTEHLFSLHTKLEAESDVRIYDVGGARNQRHTWMPFFDDVNAIVFLAPMSAFDQTLAEAPEVNRLEDTFALWKSTCRSPLLQRVPLVLLLNKRDVLQRKLAAGTRFGRYVRSYTGPNTAEDVSKYLKTKFKAVQRELSPEPRGFYAHITCATDTKQMAIILGAIEDLVLRRNLEDIKLL